MAHTGSLQAAGCWGQSGLGKYAQLHIRSVSGIGIEAWGIGYSMHVIHGHDHIRFINPKP